MRMVIFTGGELIRSRLVDDAIKKADMLVAVDSGADTALKCGVTPEVVIGDLDSIDPKTKKELEDKGMPFKISPTEKDETDTELGIEYVIEKGATEITLLGGVYGDRIDHILGNIFYATQSKVPITFINGLQMSFVKKGPSRLSISGQKNDLLSLIPLSEDVTGLTSSGLQWELHDSTLAWGMPRGISNVFLQDTITLSWKKGWLWITHTVQE